ncbi:CHAT domain-containing protein [Laspinema olomoucense]|uniref:CHAT domain-containing protein n=1 Tax=Laspinema olomoucense TaxID=3231600 RepID=UPI0021BAD241|nr:CHAT domain-containing protein [Laspinema sp. D3d]MCT7973430.1 CHAT domain-containing protein [Laspinema sp. D3d]
MITKYCDFILFIDKEKKSELEAGKLSVRVLQSPAGESQLSEIVSIPSTLHRRLRQLESRNLDLKDIIILGEELGNLLFPEQVCNLFIKSLERLQSDEGLRLRLKLESSLTSIPWEYLYLPVLSGGKRDSTGFCALHPKISLVRHELVSKAPQLHISPKSCRLLVALASPQNKEPLNIAKERTNIESALTNIPGIKAQFLENATAEGLMDQLSEGADIFHFAGHGKFKTSPLDPNRGFILLLDEDGNSAPMSAEQLAINLRERGVQLVVLGACETGRRDEQNVWDGVVTALMEAGIPAAVAMQYKIGDRSAIAFSRSFYKALAAGLSLDQSVSAGRLAIFNLCDSLSDEEKQRYWRDWGVPVLYWRGEGSFSLLTNRGFEEIKTLSKSLTIRPRIFKDRISIDFEGISQQILQILQKEGYEKDIVEFAQVALPDNAILEDDFTRTELSWLTQILRYQCLDKFLKLLENKTSQREVDNLPKPLESYLLVKVESQKSSEYEQFRIKAWLVEDNSLIKKDGNSAFQPLLDGVTCNQAEIKKYLNKGRNKAKELLQKSLQKSFQKTGKIKRFNLKIEVFLPKEFLNIEVDQWKLESEGDESDSENFWGVKYGLRVRSVERLELGYLVDEFDNWCQKWEKVSQILDQYPHPPLESFESLEDLHSLNSEQLPHQLNQKIGLKLTCSTTSEQFDVLVKAVLKAATPIALWPRCPHPNPNYAESINQLLTYRPLRQLSESVQELRSASRGQGPDHLGCHLGFLWEDPYRCPPWEPLKQTGE